jgi:transposase
LVLACANRARLGLTRREYSSGKHRILGRISKRGYAYVRMLLVHGARALANKLARTDWAIWHNNTACVAASP